MYITLGEFCVLVRRAIHNLRLPVNHRPFNHHIDAEVNYNLSLSALHDAVQSLHALHRDAIKHQWAFFMTCIHVTPSHPVVTAAFDVVEATLRSALFDGAPNPVLACAEADDHSVVERELVTTVCEQAMGAVGLVATEQHELGDVEYVETEQHSIGELGAPDQINAPVMPSMWGSLRIWRIAAIANLLLVLAFAGFMVADNQPEMDEPTHVDPDIHLLVEARPGQHWSLTATRTYLRPQDTPDVRFLELLSGVNLRDMGLVLYLDQVKDD